MSWVSSLAAQGRAFAKCPRLMAHLLRGLWIIQRRFPGMTQEQREAQVVAWAQRCLDLLNVRLLQKGIAPAAGPVLLVSNHISWLDILVMHASCYCRFVSKADIKHWPMIGALATGAGTLYVERESRRDAMRVVHRMAESLRVGEVVAVFPEGTTSDGSTLLPFHGNLLQAALSTGTPVQPIALQFFDSRSLQISLSPSYIGEESFLVSVWRTLTVQTLVARLSFGQTHEPNGRSRREWAAQLRSDVSDLMREPLSL